MRAGLLNGTSLPQAFRRRFMSRRIGAICSRESNRSHSSLAKTYLLVGWIFLALGLRSFVSIRLAGTARDLYLSPWRRTASSLLWDPMNIRVAARRPLRRGRWLQSVLVDDD